ncbi:MAG: hypothetical protein FWC39_05820 [Bacteroidetes bacterium]|nr:hypothetical protein [Bacteroidota bacterium]
MKKVFNLTLIAIALIAATMTSCRKTFGDKDIDFKYQDITENTLSFLVIDSKTNNAIEGAIIRDSEGNEVATTSIGGTATYIKKAADVLYFTVEADGYATMLASLGTVKMYKLNGKSSGIATYADKAGNVKPVPPGTEISAQTVSSAFVKPIYKTTVGSDGGFEFTGLPNDAAFEFVAPTIIDGNPYDVNSSFTAATVATPKTVRYSYIGTELFTVVSYPGVVRATNTVVIKFNKAVDKEYTENRIRVNGSESGFTADFSLDGKTLTLTPTAATGWDDVAILSSFGVSGTVYTAADAVTGRRQSTGISFTVTIIK